jgi:hypothetical protein
VTPAPLAVPNVVGSNVTVSVAVWLGIKVNPADTPLALNPAPTTETPEIVTFVFPALVNVVVSGVLVLRLTFPKLKLVELAVSCVVAATEVPLKGIVSCAGDPFVVSTTDPLTGVDEAEAGVNTALNVALLPAAIVVAVDRPVTLNPLPVTLICENVRVVFPVFLSKMLCELLLPTTTLLNVADAGVADATAWRPVPDKAIVAGEFGALLLIEILPAGAPALVGVNVAVKVVFWPAVRILPAAKPLIL